MKLWMIVIMNRKMRDIKFRGNGVETNEQVFGHLFYFKDGRYFISPTGVSVEGDYGEYPSEYILRGLKCIEIKPETVSQYTGRKDDNGIEIYEGDIYRYKYYFDSKRYEYRHIIVEWDTTYIAYEGVFNGYELADEGIEVVGNIYENPELLQDEER